MKLRSMSRRPPPPYTYNDSQRFMNSHDSATKKQNGPSRISVIYITNVSSLQPSQLIKKFGDPCVYTMQKFRCQILNWSSCTNCGQYGSKCLYTLKEPKPYESNVIRAVHLAPNLRTVEKIKISFDEVNKTCVATGESVSTEWFRIFDYGTNYCNLRNLVIGTGFDKNPKFLELTTNEVCTQYNMAVCK
ncbi:hypothetical protein ANTPLA_LOCUS9680 [Anthophora plagiata]